MALLRARERYMELGIVAPVTVAELLAGLIQDYQIQGRKSTRTTQAHIKPVVQALGHLAAKDITPTVLRQYAQGRLGEGKQPATINREFSALRKAMSLAADDGVLDKLPRFFRLKETGLRQGVYTREEFERIYTELADHLKPVARFGYLTGRRKGEILQIKWADVDLGSGYLTIRASTTKTGQPDRIPLFGELRVLLESLERKGEYLFTYRGGPIKNAKHGWRAACERAGLPDKLFHDLRRTVATDLITSGADYKTAMAVTGHKSMAVFQRYQIVNPESVKAAMARLEQHRKGD